MMSVNLVLVALLAAMPGPDSTPSGPQDAPPPVYRADAVFDSAARRLHGGLQLTLPAGLLGDRRRIRLDLAAGGEDAEGAMLTLGPVQPSRPATITHEEKTLLIDLAAPVPDRDTVSVSMQFSTRVWPGLEQSLGYPAFWGDRPGRLWYPDLLGPDGSRVRVRDFDVTLTYPDDHAVLTSGREVESAPVPGRMRRSRYVARDVEGFASSPWSRSGSRRARDTPSAGGRFRGCS
jgi:hypothetical protein